MTRILAIIALLLTLGACSSDESPGKESLNSWVTGYVDLLNKSDAPGLTNYLGGKEDDAKARIAQYGGKDLFIVTIAMNNPDSPNTYKVDTDVLEDKTNKKITMHDTATWESGRWNFAPLQK